MRENLALWLIKVRPLAGAGIEIFPQQKPGITGVVRPLAGAGIEIFVVVLLLWKNMFAPSRGRELK